VNIDALSDWPAWCSRCTYPGAHRPPTLDIGPTYRCVGCGHRWCIDLTSDATDPAVLRGVAVPAA